MKSFADWTDEIRALMNPPAPRCDGIQIHTALEQQAHAYRTMTGRRAGKSALQNEWYQKAMEIMANTDYRNLEQRVIQNGSALWGIDPGAVGGDYTVVIHDEVRIESGYDKKYDSSCRECNYLNFGCGAHETDK